MKYTIKLLILLTSMLLLMACATGYHEPYYGNGYYDERLNPKLPIYQVSARYNGYTSSQRCADIALRRSAEVCEMEHTDGFTVFDKNNSVSQSQASFTYNTAERAVTTVNYNYYSNTGYVGNGYGSATTTYQQPHTVNYTVYKPRTSMMIGCINEDKYDSFGVVYDNKQVLHRTKYLIKP